MADKSINGVGSAHSERREALKADTFSGDDALIIAALEADGRFIDSLCEPGYPATLLTLAGKRRVSPKVGNPEAIPTLRGFFYEHVRCGSSAATMSAQLRTRLDVAPGLARLIAIAGMREVCSAITRHRCASLGVTEYRWRSICAYHMERDGTIFKWDDPPEGGHPGEDGLCKCWAEAVLPLLDDLDALIVHGDEPSPLSPTPSFQNTQPLAANAVTTVPAPSSGPTWRTRLSNWFKNMARFLRRP